MGQQSRVAASRAGVYPALALEEYHFCLVTGTVESGSGRMRTFCPVPGSFVTQV